ncbi:MAG TPA: aryl-sulfate sulfotransferase [Thermoanaerobaculia bacterium]|nr:aryl-sulfate sulfotransferase [Thermoanaerobaculia bacterium]
MLPGDARRRLGIVLLAVLWTLPPALWAVRRRSPPRRATPARPAGHEPRRKPDAGAAPGLPLVAFDGQARSPSVPSDAAALSPLLDVAPPPHPDSGLRGVTVGRAAAVSPGLSFFFSPAPPPAKAFLIDRNGKVVWRWSIELDPGDEESRPRVEDVELLPDGSVLCVLRDRAVLKLDRDSRRVWECRVRAHHDLWPDSSGDIEALTHERRIVREIHSTIPIESDAIAVLTRDGRVKDSIPLLDVFRRSGYDYLLPRLQGALLDPKTGALDVFRLDHVESLDGSLAARSPIYAKGNLLFSLGNLDVIGIIDVRTRRIVWLWGPGNLGHPNDARMLPNGHVLIFDGGVDRSQVIEIEPLSQTVVWRYAAPKTFPSSVAGTAQRLSNGNTLITESAKGCAVEVTRSGETVWEYGTGENDTGPGGIVRMTRVDPARLTFLPK